MKPKADRTPTVKKPKPSKIPEPLRDQIRELQEKLSKVYDEANDSKPTVLELWHLEVTECENNLELSTVDHDGHCERFWLSRDLALAVAGDLLRTLGYERVILEDRDSPRLLKNGRWERN